MQREHAAAQALVLKCLAQHAGALDGAPVVGEAEGPLVGELGHLGELLALKAAGDRGEKADGNARFARRCIAQRAKERSGIEHGVGVGHCDDGAVASCGGGAGTGVEVLLVLLAGRAQVHMGIDEGG